MALITDTKILIVDDNLDFHTVATAALQRIGYEVKSLFEGQGKSVCRMAATCDIVLLDIDLPGESGIEISKQIKSDPTCRGIPIILITGNADADHLCEQSGADACLPKPFSSAELIRQVELLLIHPSG